MPPPGRRRRGAGRSARMSGSPGAARLSRGNRQAKHNPRLRIHPWQAESRRSPTCEARNPGAQGALPAGQHAVSRRKLARAGWRQRSGPWPLNPPGRPRRPGPESAARPGPESRRRPGQGSGPRLVRASGRRGRDRDGRDQLGPAIRDIKLGVVRACPQCGVRRVMTARPPPDDGPAARLVQYGHGHPARAAGKPPCLDWPGALAVVIA
jgi:hypothetical protein